MDPLDGKPPHLLGRHDFAGGSLATSPDDRWVASAGAAEIRLWPIPDLTQPPFVALPHERLMAKLRALTNVQVVADEASATGYRLEIGPFPGWKDVPTW